MTELRRVPPGHAGRMWLRRRLHTAERGADLLDRKHRVLRGQQQSNRLAAERAAAEWAAACRDAEAWLLRASVLGGRRSIRHATPDRAAEVRLDWAVVMGVRLPTESTVRCGEPGSGAATPGNGALVRAVDAYRRALEAAGRHAVADGAARRIDAEIAATRRRLRAVEDRWIPRLTEALREVEVGLDELEHAEGTRLRWARDQRRCEP